MGYLIYLNKNLLAFNSVQQRGSKRPAVSDGQRDEYPGLKMPPTPMDGEPQPTMATGTCEAEYMALSLAVKELIWIYMLLRSMGVNVRRPYVVYEDNTACAHRKKCRSKGSHSTQQITACRALPDISKYFK